MDPWCKSPSSAEHAGRRLGNSRGWQPSRLSPPCTSAVERVACDGTTERQIQVLGNGDEVGEVGVRSLVKEKEGEVEEVPGRQPCDLSKGKKLMKGIDNSGSLRSVRVLETHVEQKGLGATTSSACGWRNSASL